jgi:two-component system, sensor histidine kinase and response regulator
LYKIVEMEEREVTVLIIDDKVSNINALETLLEKSGRKFLNATSGKAGLKLALDQSIDLIFLDVQMPEMNGFEVAQILKSNKRTRDIPIIFASAEMKERQSIMKGFDEGAVDYLSKPLDPELTKAKVSVLLKLQAQKKELMEKNHALELAETRIKNLNADLQTNLLQMETMNNELESFSYSVSHDLRAPLRSIIGYSEILNRDYSDKLDTEGKRVLGIIQRNSNRMNTLIDDLLEFSKFGRKPLTKSEVDTESLVAKVISDLGAVNHKAKIETEALPVAYADRSLLTQVWVNLLSNAIKYSSKKEEPQIKISSKRTDDELIYLINDNGTGFDMAFANKLFNVFQRLHKASEFEGTGVGLALVQKIVHRHGGRVWAESKVGEGATFYFSLPVHVVN